MSAGSGRPKHWPRKLSLTETEFALQVRGGGLPFSSVEIVSMLTISIAMRMTPTDIRGAHGSSARAERCQYFVGGAETLGGATLHEALIIERRVLARKKTITLPDTFIACELGVLPGLPKRIRQLQIIIEVRKGARRKT